MNKFEKVSKKQYDFDAWGGKHMVDYDEIKLSCVEPDVLFGKLCFDFPAKFEKSSVVVMM